MDNFITTDSGKKIEIKVNLPYGIKGGANWSKLIINDKEIHADWFVLKTGELRCLSDDFEINGTNFVAKGEATVSGELKQWLENKVFNLNKPEEFDFTGDGF